ncbi:hypothetical protein [Dyella choica]|uniref:Uncharacterized protein n=1 Tax=Dyella choica TaxID=1927959 RepID=A0A432M1G6_9GAMM|nr:hypothetical protein [Dyella choica]RUL71055.1 hypothetical protein EKH80_19095 [Dyella choica]
MVSLTGLRLSFGILSCIVTVALASAWRESVMTMRTLVQLAMVMLLAGCAAGPPATVKHRVPHGSTIAVVMLQDCDIAKQADCDGSGLNASSIFVSAISRMPGLQAVSLARPVGPKAALSDDAAIAYAREKGYRYVLNGEVQDYFRTGNLLFHSNHAGVSVRLLSTSSGQVQATYTYQKHSRTHSPDAILEKMAKRLAASIILEKKGEREGKFLLYNGNG